MFDYTVTKKGRAYSEFREFTEERQLNIDSPDKTTGVQNESASKEQYLKNKQEAADARKKAHRTEKLKAEMQKLEDELTVIEEKMMGEAATDYKKVAELDLRKTEIEERLMEIYEELENN